MAMQPVVQMDETDDPNLPSSQAALKKQEEIKKIEENLDENEGHYVQLPTTAN